MFNPRHCSIFSRTCFSSATAKASSSGIRSIPFPFRFREQMDRMYLFVTVGRRNRDERSYNDPVWSCIWRTSRRIFGILRAWLLSSLCSLSDSVLELELRSQSDPDSESMLESASPLMLLIESWSDPTAGSYFRFAMTIARAQSAVSSKSRLSEAVHRCEINFLRAVSLIYLSD